MAEAQACGTPVVAYGQGGALDIVTPGVSGWLLRSHDVEELRAVVRQAAVEDLDSDVIRRGAERFSAQRFRAEIVRAVKEVI